MVAHLDDARAVRLFVEDVEAALDPDPLQVAVSAVGDGHDVTVTARSLARDVMLLVDRLDPAAGVDDGLVTLPAGASVTFRVQGPATSMKPTLGPC